MIHDSSSPLFINHFQYNQLTTCTAGSQTPHSSHRLRGLNNEIHTLPHCAVIMKWWHSKSSVKFNPSTSINYLFQRMHSVYKCTYIYICIISCPYSLYIFDIVIIPEFSYIQLFQVHQLSEMQRCPRCPGQGVLGSTRTSRISWIALVEKKINKNHPKHGRFLKKDGHRIHVWYICLHLP